MEDFTLITSISKEARIRFQKIAKETQDILRRGYYKLHGKKVDLSLSSGIYDFESVEVFSPKDSMEIQNDVDGFMKNHFYAPDDHEIRVCRMEAYEAAKGYFNPLILNCANAFYPGGGFLAGLDDVEERLCRASSVYQSLSSQKASQMYLYHDYYKSKLNSDFMLLSPSVAIFRNSYMELISHPYPISVISVSCVDRKKSGNHNLTETEIDITMKDRIRKIFAVAARKMYRNLIIGAFGYNGCGHSSNRIARYFYDILIEEEYIEQFEHIVFAISYEAEQEVLDNFTNVFEPIAKITNQNLHKDMRIQNSSKQYPLAESFHSNKLKQRIEPFRMDPFYSVEAIKVSESVKTSETIRMSETIQMSESIQMSENPYPSERSKRSESIKTSESIKISESTKTLESITISKANMWQADMIIEPDKMIDSNKVRVPNKIIEQNKITGPSKITESNKITEANRLTGPSKITGPKELTGPTDSRKITGSTESNKITGSIDPRRITGPIDSRKITGEIDSRKITGEIDSSKITGPNRITGPNKTSELGKSAEYSKITEPSMITEPNKYTESKEKATSYIQSRYPIPECNYSLYAQHQLQLLGFAQGILQNGIPFVAELNRNTKFRDPIAVFVLPFMEEIHQMKRERREKRSFLPSVLCYGMDVIEYNLTDHELNAYLAYLMEHNLIRFQKNNIDASGQVLYDKIGNKIVAIQFILGSKNKINDIIPLEFQAHPKR